MKHFFLLFLILSASLVGQEEARLTKEERLHWLEKWKSLNQESPQKKNSQLYHFPTVSGAVQVLYSLGVAGEWLQLVDGSDWKIGKQEKKKVADWQAGDQLFITQADCTLCDEQYRLVNITRGVMVHAKRHSKPLSHVSTAKTVIAIDTYDDIVYLSDGTCWNVTWLDEAVMTSWHLGDQVIMAVNSGYNRADYPALLINVSADAYDLGLDSWVSARQMY